MGRFSNIVILFLKRVGGKVIREALQDSDLAAFVADMVQERFGDLGDGTLIRDFVKALWENREAILEFVLTIIGLFSTPDGGQLMMSAEDAAVFPVEALAAACEQCGTFKVAA